jgi:hypothetical protein
MPSQTNRLFCQCPGNTEVAITLASQIPLTQGFKTYKCIFGDKVADGTLQSDLKTLKCLSPKMPAPVTLDVDVTINQGQACETSGRNKCCSIHLPCFLGSLSNLPKPFVFFDEFPINSESAISFSLPSSRIHAHIFSHGVHDWSNLQHSHIIFVESEYILAKSLTTSRTCGCLRGDFDCICSDSDISHSHIYVHSHDLRADNHSHIVQVQSPALGVRPNPVLSPFEYLHEPMLPVYGLGLYDTVPARAYFSLLDASTIEDFVIQPTGFSLVVALPGNISAGSNITVVLDGTFSIQNQPNPGSTGNYYLAITKSHSVPSNICALSAGFCGNVFTRFMAAETFIVNTLYVFASLVPSISLTGAITGVAIDLINGVPYSSGSSIVIMFPKPLLFPNPPRLLVCQTSIDCVDLTNMIDASASIKVVYNEQRIGCVVDYSCVVITLRHGASAFASINFNVTGLQLPLEQIQDSLVIKIFTIDSSNVTIESTKNGVSFPPILPAPLIQLKVKFTSLIAGSRTNVDVEFLSSNPILAGNLIRLTFPPGFQTAQTTLLDIKFLQTGSESCCETVMPNLRSANNSLDIPVLVTQNFQNGTLVKFTLASLQNKPIPDISPSSGSSGDLLIQVLSAQQQVISAATFRLPALSPAALLMATASISSVQTGARAKLNLSFTTTTPIVAGSDLIISLPAGFALCSDMSYGWKLLLIFDGLLDKKCVPTICPKDVANCSLPACTPALPAFDNVQVQISFGVNCTNIPANSRLSFQVSYIRNALIQGPSGKLSAYTRNLGKCDPCAREENIVWSQGLTDFYLKTSNLVGVSLNLSSMKSGFKSNASITFTTSNSLPTRSWVVIDLPQYFQLLANGWVLSYNVSWRNSVLERRNVTSGSCCRSGANLSDPGVCCSSGQLIFFQMTNAVPSGSFFIIHLSGIMNRIAAGTATFQIRTAVRLWNFVDKAVVSLVITPPVAQASAHPTSYVLNNIAGPEQEVPSNQLLVGVLGTFFVRLKTENELPADGSVQVEFSAGFSLENAKLKGNVSGMQGNVKMVVGQRTVTLYRENGFSQQSGTVFDFNLTGIRHPISLEKPSIVVRTLAQLGADACLTCKNWQISECQNCFTYGTIDESLILYPGDMNPGHLSRFSIYLEPSSSDYLFLNVLVSAHFKFLTVSNLTGDSIISIQLPPGFAVHWTSSLSNSSHPLTYDAISTGGWLQLLVDLPIPAGSEISFSISNIRSTGIPTNTSIFSVTTNASKICPLSNCMLERGSTEAFVWILDPEGSVPLTASPASIGALAASPTKNSAYSVTLFWNFSTHNYQNITNYDAYIASENTQLPSVQVNTASGSYVHSLSESFKGALLSFFIMARIGGRDIFFGLSKITVLDTSGPPENLAAVVTSPLQVVLSWKPPQDQGAGIGKESVLLGYVLEMRLQNSPILSLRIKSIACCPGLPACCNKVSILLEVCQVSQYPAVPCLDTSFAGQSVNFRMKAVNAAGSGPFGQNVSVIVIGRAGKLNISVRSYSSPNSSLPGIYMNWTSPGRDFDFGYGVANIAKNSQILQSFFFELAMYAVGESVPRTVVLPSNITGYLIDTGLIAGQQYSFQIRVNTGEYPGEWSELKFITAIKRPSMATIARILIISESILSVYVYVPLETELSAVNLGAFGLFVHQARTNEFRACCSSNSSWLGCDGQEYMKAEFHEERTFSVENISGSLEFSGILNIRDQVNGVFVFNATNLTRGAGYSFKVLPFNEAGPSVEWSPPSETVQCQGSPLLPLRFDPPVPGEGQVHLSWKTTDPSTLSDFTYVLTSTGNPRYPIDGSIKEGSPADNLPFSPSEATNFPKSSDNVQHIRTFGARNIDSVTINGKLLIVAANSRSYSAFNIKPIYSMLEATMIFEWNNSTQQFGGSCSWGNEPNCGFIGPVCAAFAEHPECMIDMTDASQSGPLPETGSKQLIQSFGAIQAKFLTIADQVFLIVLNTKNANHFHCFFNFSGLLGPVKRDVSIRIKRQIQFITKCNGVDDNSSCGADEVCRPSAFSTDRNITSTDPGSESLGSISYLYKWSESSELFLEHSFFRFRTPSHIESFTAMSCVPDDTCAPGGQSDACNPCISPAEGCVCKNTTFMVVCDETGPSYIYYWNSSNDSFEVLQTLETSGAKASKFFFAFNSSLLFIANGYNRSGVPSNIESSIGNYTPKATSYVYRLQDGTFQKIESLQTHGANHVESFERHGRRFLVVCNGVDNFLGGHEPDQSQCTTNVSCPVLYEWLGGSHPLRLIQSFDGFGLNQAFSSTAFTRSTGNESDNFLIFANYRSSHSNSAQYGAYSRLYRWTSTKNVWGSGELIFDKFALVRKIYTSGARVWAVIHMTTGPAIAVANEADFEINTPVSTCDYAKPPCAELEELPCLELPCRYNQCNYLPSNSCCGMAGAPCFAILSDRNVLYSPFNDRYKVTQTIGFSSVFMLPDWPRYSVDLLYNCSLNTFIATTMQTSEGKADWEYYGDETLFTVSAVNKFASSKSTSISVRPIRLPGAPELLSVGPKGNRSLAVKFLPPVADGEVFVAGRSRVRMNYKVIVISGVVYSFYSANCTTLQCVKSVTTSQTEFRISGLNSGQLYSVVVFAVNPAGEGPASNILSGLTFGSPGKVRNLKVDQQLGPMRFNLSWNRPSDLGTGSLDMNATSEFSLYYKLSVFIAQASGSRSPQAEVEQRYGPVLKEVMSVNLPADLDTRIIFKKGFVYFFSVAASTEGGEGEEQWVSGCALGPSSRPILNSVEVAGPGKLSLNWFPPTDSGAGTGRNCWNPQLDVDDGYIKTAQYEIESIILLYSVEISDNMHFVPLVPINGSDFIRVPSTRTSALIDGLQIGKVFFFRVIAETRSGSSLPSRFKTSVVGNVPSPPRNLYVEATAPLTLKVSFMRPADTGLGIDGTQFVLSSFDMDVSLDREFSSYVNQLELQENTTFKVFTGLTAGVIHFFRVRASNKVGIGQYSSPVPGIPLNVPGIPQQVQAGAGKGLVMLLIWKVICSRC